MVSRLLLFESLDLGDGARLNLTLTPGERVSVVCPDRLQRGLLLRYVAGVEGPSGGRIELFGRSSEAGKGGGFFAEPGRVGFVENDGGLINNLSVFENVCLPTLYHDADPSVDEIRDRALAFLEKLEYHGETRGLPGNLSIGERRRIALARVLTLEPALIVADALLAGLETRDRREFLLKIRALMIETSGDTAVLYLAESEAEAAELGLPVKRLDSGLAS